MCVGTTVTFCIRTEWRQLVSRTIVLLNSVHCSSVLRCNETDGNTNPQTRLQWMPSDDCNQTYSPVRGEATNRGTSLGWCGNALAFSSQSIQFSLQRSKLPYHVTWQLELELPLFFFFFGVFQILQNLPVSIYDKLTEHHERPRSEAVNKISRQYAVL